MIPKTGYLFKMSGLDSAPLRFLFTRFCLQPLNLPQRADTKLPSLDLPEDLQKSYCFVPGIASGAGV